MDIKTDTGEFEQMYLQSLISKTSFAHETVISKKSDQKGQAGIGITTELHSVMNTILPNGYEFAIIDEDGNTLFHSNKQRILKENFTNETGGEKEIQSTLFSRIGGEFNFKYYGNRYMGFISPVNTLPLYLVTFYNKTHLNEQIEGVISLTVLFLGILFLSG